MIFHNIRTDFNFIFGQFSVTRKLILNGGAIRPTGLLLYILHRNFILLEHYIVIMQTILASMCRIC